MPLPLLVVVMLALSVIPPTAVHALENDRDQVAWIDADEVDLDFATGKRIYRGNVSIKQGTIRIIADEVELFYQGEQLEKAIAHGNPAVLTRTTKAPEQSNAGSSQSPATLVTSDSDRPRIVLQPRSKETSAATVASTGSPGAKDSSTATHSNGLQTAAFRAAYVVEGGALMYGVRSQASPSIGALNAGEPAKVITSSDGWSKVNVTRGVRVWIYGRYVSGQGPTGIVSGDNVRLRSAPSTGPDSVVVGKLMNGARVRILEVSNNWKMISPPVSFGVWVPSLRLRLLQNVNDTWSTTWQNNLSDDEQ